MYMDFFDVEKQSFYTKTMLLFSEKIFKSVNDTISLSIHFYVQVYLFSIYIHSKKKKIP